MDTEVLGLDSSARIFIKESPTNYTMCYPTNEENLKEQTKFAVIAQNMVRLYYFKKTCETRKNKKHTKFGPVVSNHGF